MVVKIVVEMISGCNLRWRYSEISDTFIAEQMNSIFLRNHGFRGIYGWVEGYGQPLKPHNDVLLITDKTLQLGNIVNGKIIGVFIRCDGDHKLVCVECDRNIEDLEELPDEEIKMLKRIYPGKYAGDAWLGREKALVVLGNHDRSVKWV
ncbi:MAG: hypothetical protein JXQ23_11360 [Clostridia bacterium]|nr:hypothetical protein [Clostridia bacterium]